MWCSLQVRLCTLDAQAAIEASRTRLLRDTSESRPQGGPLDHMGCFVSLRFRAACGNLTKLQPLGGLVHSYVQFPHSFKKHNGCLETKRS